MPGRWTMRLAYKSVIVVVASAAIPLALAAFVNFRATHALIASEQQRSVDAVARGIASACVADVAEENAVAVNTKIRQELLADSDIQFIAVYAEGSNVIIADGHNDSDAWRKFFHDGEVGPTTLIKKQEMFQSLDAQGKPAKGRVGEVVVGMSRSTMVDTQRKLAANTAGVLLGAVAVAVPIVLFLIGRWTRRLNQLVGATERISGGDFARSVDDEHGDEVGHLAQSFERMRLALSTRDADLRQMTDTLQQKVRDRTRDLDEARQVAERASNAKGEFLANMSHEIRTPMNGVVGMVELLSKTTLTGQQKRYADVARSSAEALLSVINDVLDFSKIEAGRMELERIAFSPRQVAESVADCCEYQASTKGVKLVRRVADEVPRCVLGDPNKLRQVLTNLMNNAVKFTERGEVSLNVVCESRGEESVTLTFSVRDTGIGIPADRRDRLFEAFMQADVSTTRKYGGTGLGLAICSRLVALMGGKIAVESSVGRGSTFSFALVMPLATQAAEDEQPVSTDSRPAGAAVRAGVRVLLAEDNDVNQLFIREVLAIHGVECHVASTGREALSALLTEPYDLVLMDCQMPDMDGFEATREVRQAEREGRLARNGSTRLPIIALTANVLPEDRDRAIRVGMDGYLTKPVETAALLETIRSHVGGAAAATDTPAEPGLTREADPIDVADLTERCQGHREVVAAILAKFSRTVHERVDAVSEGLSSGAAQKTMFAAHTLKGTAGLVGARRLSELAATIESECKSNDLPAARTCYDELVAEAHRCDEFVDGYLKAEQVSTVGS